MIVFFRRPEGLAAPSYLQPVALVDYTRSDDQWTTPKILNWVIQTGARIVSDAGGLRVSAETLQVFSLDYSVFFRHSAVNLGDALKTIAEVKVYNAPPELISLVNVKQVTGAESVLSIENALRFIVDAKTNFPFAVMVFETQNSLLPSQLSRNFIVYGTSYNFDDKRLNSVLTLRCAAFDSAVMRLQFNVDLKKTRPLLTQVRTALSAGSAASYTVTADPSLEALLPLKEKFYAPAPVTKVLDRICRDNNILYDLNTDTKIIKFKSLVAQAVPVGSIPVNLCFRGTMPLSYLISSFSVFDYAGAVFKSELFNISLFDQVSIIDDSAVTVLASTLFRNFTPLPGVFTARALPAYAFYVLEYEIFNSRYETSLTLKTTNNWVLSQLRLDTLFEAAVYLSQGAG